jgi:hypothetical protein
VFAIYILYICSVILQQIYIKAMTIPNEALNKWNELKEAGDIDKLAELLDKAPSTIYQIFRTGEASLEDAEKMSDFYKKKLERLEEIKNIGKK